MNLISFFSSIFSSISCLKKRGGGRGSNFFLYVLSLDENKITCTFSFELFRPIFVHDFSHLTREETDSGDAGQLYSLNQVFATFLMTSESRFDSLVESKP